MRLSDHRAQTGPLLLLAATLVAGCALLLLPANGSGRDGDRRGEPGGVEPPRVPDGAAPSPSTSSGTGLRLSGRRLLAGLPGQRLRVALRMDGAADPASSVRFVLRRLAAPDPRHPGVRITGAEVGAVEVSAGPRFAAGLLDGLNPQPGPHRVDAVGPDGEVLASAPVTVLPQVLAPPRGAGAGSTAPQGRAAAGPVTRALAAGDVNHDLSFQPGSEASSAIAVERDNPDRVIAATNDFGAAPQAFVSNEGLASGTVGRRLIPTLTEMPGPGSATETIETCCDPAVAADSDGNLWMAASTMAAEGRIAVNRIAAGSTAFQGTSVGLPTEPGSTAQGKPALAVLDGDRIAAAWVETLADLQNIVYSECDISGNVSDCDDPDNWSGPAPLTGAGGLVTMPAITFAPNGDAYAVWWNAGASNAVEIDRCETGEDCTSGGSWDEDATIADLDAFDDDGVGGPDPLPLFCPIIAAPAGLVNPSPSVATAADGTVFVAYGDLRDNADAGDPSRCTASGTDKTFDAFVAAGAAPNAIPTANTGVRLSNDLPLALNDHFLPALTVDPSTGEVEATFYSTGDDPGGQHATRVLVGSNDLGLTYSAPVPVAGAASRFSGPLSDGIDYGDRHGAASADGTLRTAWTDNRPLQGRDPDLYATAPQIDTTITAGPSGTVPDASSTFAFNSKAPRIECSRDGGALTVCTSPHPVGPLANGDHKLVVRAVDMAGNPMDLTPAIAEWTIADLQPPETTITRKPKNKTKEKRPKFEFVSDEVGVRFECRYDGLEWVGCTSPRRKRVDVGRHKFEVRAIDLGDNADPTPASDRFKRKRKCSKKKRRKGKC